MAKVITFSRKFPVDHPKRGEPTHFVEKFWASINDVEFERQYPKLLTSSLPMLMGDGVIPKLHTIRSGSRWKVGDKFSPRVWSGSPYNSKQIVIAPDTEIKKIYKIEIYYFPDEDKDVENPPEVFINDKFCCEVGSVKWDEIAKNDGLTGIDFTDWFIKKNFKFIKGVPIFSGQIICWNESINY